MPVLGLGQGLSSLNRKPAGLSDWKHFQQYDAHIYVRYMTPHGVGYQTTKIHFTKLNYLHICLLDERKH